MLRSIQTDLEYVHSVVAGLEKEWVYFSAFFFFDGYKQKSINIVKDWKDCKCVCVCVSHIWCHKWTSFPRFSTELSSGLLEVISPPASYYPDLNNLKETFGDSKERVRYGSQSCDTEWGQKMWWQLLWKRWRNQPWENEIGQSCDEDCRKTIKDESGESRRGESRRELLGRLRRYLVFHRHFSKSDQGHQQQHPLPLSLCSVQLLLSSLLIFAL